MSLKLSNFTSIKHQSNDWLGIDIGTAAIKVVRAAKVRGDWSVKLRRLIPAPSGEVINCETIRAGILESIFQEHLPLLKINQQQKAACVLSSSVMELQTVELPIAQPAEVRQMLSVDFDAREDGRRREFDFFENEKVQTPNAESSHWSVLSIPSETATGLAESLWRKGIHCEKLNTLPCVLAQAVQMTQTEISKPALALDWGATTPSLTLVANGKPTYSRLLRNCGLEKFLLAGSEEFHCNPSQFFEMLTWVNLNSPHGQKQNLTKTREAIMELCIGVLEQLSQEIHRTLAYLKQEYPKKFPQSMWLFGGGAIIPEICKSLTEKTSLPTQLWQTPKLRSDNVHEVDPLEAIFGTAITLSIQGRKS